MSVDVGDVVRVVAQWAMPESTIAQMVYHYIGASGSSVADVTLANAIEGQLTTAWVNIEDVISDEVVGENLELFKWDFANHQWDGLTVTPMVGIDGANVTDLSAHGVAALVKIMTAKNRRQARKYVPGIIEATITDGVIAPATVTDLALFGAALDSDLTAGSLTLDFGVFSTDPLSPWYETFSAAIQTVQASGNPAYQRRRRPGTGI